MSCAARWERWWGAARRDDLARRRDSMSFASTDREIRMHLDSFFLSNSSLEIEKLDILERELNGKVR